MRPPQRKHRTNQELSIGAVDDLLASVGLRHGSRRSLTGEPAINRNPLPDKQTIQVVRAPWEGYAWLRHGFSTRLGGKSSAYGPGDLNLGWTNEDSTTAVTESREQFLKFVVSSFPPQAAGTRTRHAAENLAERLVTIRQFHSGMIRTVRVREWAGGGLVSAEGRAILRGDGLMTDVPGVLLGIQTADCVPVILADVKRRAVAIFHAGWRGTLARIVERGVGMMRLQYGSQPEEMVAAVGPAIGDCCYAVGEEVRHEFESQFAYAPSLFSEVYDSDPVKEKYPMLFMTARAPGHSNLGPQIHLDLWEANRRQLLDAGLSARRVTVVAECTACTRVGERMKYFSHRGEHGFTGRMMSVVGVANQDRRSELRAPQARAAAAS